MRPVLRVLVALAGALALLVALQFWLHPAAPAARLGVEPMGDLGLATIRADVAGFFAAAGLLSLAAAVRADKRLMTAPLLLIGLALVGRLITVAVSGLSPDMVQPMVVEAALLLLFGVARRRL